MPTHLSSSTLLPSSPSAGRRFMWDRVSLLLGTSLATVKWDIPDDTPEGTYRLTHNGHFKSMLFGLNQYSGASEPFEVSSPRVKDRLYGISSDGFGYACLFCLCMCFNVCVSEDQGFSWLNFSCFSMCVSSVCLFHYSCFSNRVEVCYIIFLA